MCSLISALGWWDVKCEISSNTDQLEIQQLCPDSLPILDTALVGQRQ